MGRAGRRPADQQRLDHAATLHLGGDIDHFVEARRDEAGETDHVHPLLFRRVENGFRRHHDAEIDDLVAVASQHDADDVLADIVHVAFHGRHQDPAIRRVGRAEKLLFLFEVRLQPGDGLFHHTGGFDHLRQEHLAGAEQVTDDIHAVHQRAFDNVQRAVGFLTRLFRILIDEFGDAVHEGMFEPLLHRRLAPGQVLDGRLALLALQAFRDFDQSFGGVGAAVEDDILDALAQVGFDIVIDVELAGIDDPHVHARGDGVVEEHRVHRPAHRLVAAKAERDVREAARDVATGTGRADLTRSLDEVHRVIVVLLDAGSDSEDVGVEDDVFRREAHLFRQDTEGALADFHLAGFRIRLPDLVERHDDHGRTIGQAGARLFAELLLALLHGDRVDDALALHAFEAGFDHLPFGRVDHHRHAGNVRLGSDQVEEGAHGFGTVKHALIHVDVDHLRAVLHLLAGDLDGVGIAAFRNHLAEDGGAGDVGALTDVHEGLGS